MVLAMKICSNKHLIFFFSCLILLGSFGIDRYLDESASLTHSSILQCKTHDIEEKGPSFSNSSLLSLDIAVYEQESPLKWLRKFLVPFTLKVCFLFFFIKTLFVLYEHTLGDRSYALYRIETLNSCPHPPTLF